MQTEKRQVVSEKWEQLLCLVPGYDPIETAGDCWFDEEAAQLAIDFFHEHLKFIEGEKAGQTFILEDWQQCIVANLFGWKRPDGLRRYRESFIFVARKNGKTPFCAGIINYMAFCDKEPGAQIYSTAGEREQASLTYRHAIGMINRNPMLKKRCRAYKTFKSIEYYKGDVVYKALSADADTKHGLNAQLVVNDELHVQPNRHLVDTMETSTASRRQPLIIHITTAGFDKLSICYEKYDYACKVRDGIIEDESFLPIIYEIDEEDNWTDEDVWAKANPNLGVSVSLDYLRKECKKAKEIPAYENTFRRLHLNQWTEQDERWLSMEVWNECVDDYTFADLAGEDCYAGLDLSSTTDLSSLDLFFPKYNRAISFNFAPKMNMLEREKKDKVPYSLWAKDGHLILTPGNVIDYDFIREFINDIAKKANIKLLAIDRWNATQLATQLEGDGINVVKMGQGFQSMTAPTKYLNNLLIDRKFKHNNNPVLNWAASNVAVEQDAAGNIKPSKKKSTQRIDPIVALINAIAAYVVSEIEVESVYENREALEL